jgi:hypothetical protein
LKSVEIDGAAPESFTRRAPASAERVRAHGSDFGTVGEISQTTAQLTTNQYNVLRILRGSHPARLACGDIAERMIERA